MCEGNVLGMHRCQRPLVQVVLVAESHCTSNMYRKAINKVDMIDVSVTPPAALGSSQYEGKIWHHATYLEICCTN
jgi:hypothetical protein